MNSALLILIAYLTGSIPSGYWVVKLTKNLDLRKVGSGSTGTTNVLRTAGKGAAAFVFFVDILKGIFPVWLSIFAIEHHLLPEWNGSPGLLSWIPPIVAMADLIGHSKSIFLGFKGGKSAA